eukprot:Sspe_Gene.4190::Locus_1378_Transcript_1_1_Confidence_1.000_Length_2133::g.4190::m.4190
MVSGGVLVHEVLEVPKHVPVLRVLYQCDFLPEAVDEGLELLNRRRRVHVHLHVKRGQIHLTQRSYGHVDVPRILQVLHQVVADGFPRLVVTRELLQCLFLPAPVLKHLAGGLDEVPRDLGDAGHVAVRLRADVVHDVPELMEEGHNIVVAEQGGAVCLLLWEVDQHAVHRNLVIHALEQVEDGSMVVLPLTGVHIHVELTHQLPPWLCPVVHHKEPDLLVPRLKLVARDFMKCEAQDLLVDLQGGVHDVVEREVLANLLIVNVEFLQGDLLVVEALVPGVELPVKLLAGLLVVLLLVPQQLLQVLFPRFVHAVLQVLQEVAGHFRAPRHAALCDVVGPVLVPKHGSDLLPDVDGLDKNLKVVPVREKLPCFRHLPPCLSHSALREDRRGVRVREGHHYFSCLCGLPCFTVLVRQSGQLLTGELELQLVLRDVRRVLRAELRVLGQQVCILLPLRLLELQPAPLEILQDPLNEVLLVRFEKHLLGVEPLHSLEDVLPQPSFDPELAEGHVRLLRGFPYRGIGVAVLQELRLAHHWVYLVVLCKDKRLDDLLVGKVVGLRDRIPLGTSLRQHSGNALLNLLGCLGPFEGWERVLHSVKSLDSLWGVRQ